MKQFFAYGKNAVENIILTNPSQIKKIYITKGSSFSENVYSNIKNNKIEWESIEKDLLSTKFEIKYSVHQGYVAVLFNFKYFEYEYLIKNDCKMILMLDRIQDPQNLGAIIRSASLFGVDAIIIKSINQAEITPSVIKASAGTIYNVPIIKVSSLVACLKKLKENGFWIFTSALKDESVSINTLDSANKTVVVIGNEGEGVSNSILNSSDILFKIDTTNVIDSLNVSVATGIILYSFYTKKR
ncbi:23S rRNA (guanosine2251-2'-O)-methyltransferase [Spiroplasma litorale]|uniref:23S rRNA (Guanosine2251-2'-O)-methyltransferase n=1 Tax=Spiroplasma litorale TaxID=216942 RepID=A0A0K1W0I9_9MOLU|nr:23S rRNA (guanosine(2251)-2'-O)-methyltransferase RlmB [Spiroplasma litorale]AKX33698.1 23S rRNA (guanosine2251-2'-O)-methyltransferase [Spiroplasma litorale]